MKQTNKHDCAPVGIINWWKSQGLPATAIDLPSVRKLLGTKRDGTDTVQLEKFLGRDTVQITWTQFVKHLRGVGPAIMVTNQAGGIGHTWLAHSLTRHPKTKNLGVVAINYSKHTYTYLTRHEIKHLLKRTWVARLGC